MSKPNCYECKFRATVAGSAHSACTYGDNETNTFFNILSKNNYDNAQKLDIKAIQHGVDSGWFNWPVDFDPQWLVNCDGFIKI